MRTLSEHLGLDPQTRAVILHADDVGMCHAHNVGFFEVTEAGLVTCGSVIVPCSWFPEVAAHARRRADLDLGVHLCLNSEFSSYRWRPILGPERVPTLVDREGYFWPSTMEALEAADPEEVRLELRAQIDRALAAGVDVTHLDAHMGTVMMGRLTQVYLDLGTEYRLPVFFPRPTPRVLEEVGRAEMIEQLPEMLEGFERKHLLMADHVELRSLSFEPERAEEHYRRVVAEIEPGVTHFLIHPARGGDELRAIAPDSWRQRDAERRLFAGPDARRWFAESRIERIGYRQLRDVLRSL